MTDSHRHCLDERLGEIEAMLAENALFQAGARINGSRRCAGVQGCDRWAACALAHDRLLDRLGTLLRE